jgi:hypothetical protein
MLLMLSLTMLPISPAFADDDSLAPDEDEIAQETDSLDELWAQQTGCAGHVQIDTWGIVRQGVPWAGWAVDMNETGALPGVDIIEVYRGTTLVASGTIGVPRPDVSAYLRRPEIRPGFIIEFDWLTQPRGQQTYTVRGRTRCGWAESQVTLDVQPIPPVSLSINDQRRAVSGTGYYGGGYGGYYDAGYCNSRDAFGRCLNYGSIYGGTGGCISRDIYGQCIGGYYGSGGYYGACYARDIYGQCISGAAAVGTCYARDIYGQCISGAAVVGGCYARDIYGNCMGGRYGGYYGGSGSGETNFDFTVTLSAASTVAATVNYATADGSAQAGTDYASTSGTLTFNPGETSKTITVRVYARNYPDNRTFYVRLSNPSNASVADGEGVGTIERGYTSAYSSSYYGYGSPYNPYLYNPYPYNPYIPPGTGSGSVSINSTTCVAGNLCNFTISQAGGLSSVTVTYRSQNETATGQISCSVLGADYVVTSTTVTVGPNGTATASVPTCGGPGKGGKTFGVAITSVSSGSVGNALGRGTINPM